MTTKTLNWYAFENCTSLTELTLPASLDKITDTIYNSKLTCDNLQTVTFLGNAPRIAAKTFAGTSFTAYYPAGNSTWNEATMSSYGGDVTWVPYGDEDLAASGTCGRTVNWELRTNGLLNISGTGSISNRWHNYEDDIRTVVVEEGITGINSNAFSDCTNLTRLEFLGDAPSFAEDAFNNVQAIACYPADNDTWTEEVRQNYGGTIIWATGAEDEIVQSGQSGDNVNWALDINGVLTVSCEGAMQDYADELPDWQIYNFFITDVVIADGVTTIGDRALYECGQVSSVTIPDSVFDIGYCSFWNCNKLTQLELPEQLESIDGNAFSGSGLTGLEFPVTLTTLGSEALSNCGDLTTVRFLGSAPAIGDNAFAGDTLTAYYPINDPTWTEDVLLDYGGTVTWVGEFIILEIASGYSGNTAWKLTNDGVLTISGEGNMQDYTYKTEMPWYSYFDQITSVVIEDGVSSIGSYAFYGMPRLEHIEIADSVTTIGSYAFKGSEKLDGVVLPSGLTKLGESSFYGCTSLTSIEIPGSLWTVQPYTFKNCTSLAEVTFNEGNLQKISDGAFYNTALTELVLPDCLDILDVYSFKNCANLASITLGNSLTEIREAVFYGTAISDIEIPEGIVKIAPYAFKNCVNLEIISLPSTLTSIGEASFYACTALAELDLPDAVTTIGSYAFRKCAALETAAFGSGLTNIGESSFYGCSSLKTLVIPENVTTIQSYAFKGCAGLTSINLPDALVTIGDSAFHTCTELSKITIPANVEAIGEYCFSGSTSIEFITFEGDAPSIGSGAFNKLTATAYYPGSNATWTSSVKLNYGGAITWVAK